MKGLGRLLLLEVFAASIVALPPSAFLLRPSSILDPLLPYCSVLKHHLTLIWDLKPSGDFGRLDSLEAKTHGQTAPKGLFDV